jgi:hypothetical protein
MQAGAADLKLLMKAAPLAVVFCSPAAPSDEDQAALTKALPTLLPPGRGPAAVAFGLLSGADSAPNQRLWDALKLGTTPVAQVIRAGAVVRSFRTAMPLACLAKVREALAELLADAPPAPPTAAATKAAEAAAAKAAAAAAAADGAAGSSSVWDPPTGKYGKAGATRSVPGADIPATFWPKMPCLRCGCPWWLGEEWDARCARCAWDCENGGYDDDSLPLPKHVGKWEVFTGMIKEGRTAPYSGPLSKYTPRNAPKPAKKVKWLRPGHSP